MAAAFDDVPDFQAWLSSVSRKLCEGELAVQAILHQYLECAEASPDRYASSASWLALCIEALQEDANRASFSATKKLGVNILETANWKVAAGNFGVSFAALCTSYAWCCWVQCMQT